MHARHTNKQGHSTKLISPATLQFRIQKTTTDDNTALLHEDQPHLNFKSLHQAESPPESKLKQHAQLVTRAADQRKGKRIHQRFRTQITGRMQKKSNPPAQSGCVRTGEFCRRAASAAGAARTVSSSICTPGRAPCRSEKPNQPHRPNQHSIFFVLKNQALG
jgi:hypothetical protein